MMARIFLALMLSFIPFAAFGATAWWLIDPSGGQCVLASDAAKYMGDPIRSPETELEGLRAGGYAPALHVERDASGAVVIASLTIGSSTVAWFASVALCERARVALRDKGVIADPGELR